MFKDYQESTKELLSSKPKNTNWIDVLQRHKEMITIIQHERIIHLLVTIFIGTVMSISFLATIITKEAYMLLLDTPLLFLFFGYLLHYRYLENTTQYWYRLTESIKKVLNQTED